MTSGPTKGMTFQAIGEGRHRKPVRAERALVATKGYRRLSTVVLEGAQLIRVVPSEGTEGTGKAADRDRYHRT